MWYGWKAMDEWIRWKIFFEKEELKLEMKIGDKIFNFLSKIAACLLNLIAKISKLADHENVIFFLLKNWIIKVYFHLSSNYMGEDTLYS